MAQETEIKLRIRDVPEFLKALRKLGARRIAGKASRVHQRNVVFDTAQGDLARNGHLLRIRTETPAGSKTRRPGDRGERVTVTFKRPMAGAAPEGNGAAFEGQHKVREEIELQVSNGAALAKIFEGLGMPGGFRYEKFRTTFRLPASQRWAHELLIELDETPIGTFVELEGPAAAIDRAAKELGFASRDYIVLNYLVLYREECRRRGEKPGDMLFAKRTAGE
jgi:adenylate cyclase class 2